MEQQTPAPVVPEEIQPIQKPHNTKKLGLVAAVLLLVLAVPLTLTMISQRTVSKNNAAEATPSPQMIVTTAPLAEDFKNINSSSDTLKGDNADDTMGPQTSSTNWSTGLPVSDKGKLVVTVGSEMTPTPTPMIPTPTSNMHSVMTPQPTADWTQVTPTLSPRPSTTWGPKPSGVKPSESENEKEGKGMGLSGTPGMHGKNTPNVKSLLVTISKVEVHMVTFGNGNMPTPAPTAIVPTAVSSVMPTVHQMTSGAMSVTKPPVVGPASHWETLTLPSSLVVDLMQFNTSTTLTSLGLTSLGAGTYNEIRIYIKNANVVLADGTTAQVSLPGKSGIIRIVQPFTVSPGGTTTLALKFDLAHSLKVKNGTYTLKPVVSKMDENH